MTIKSVTVSDLADLVILGRNRLAETGTITGSDIPSDELIRETVADTYTDRGKAGLRRRANPPKGAGGPARALLGLLRWHSSGGSLEGLFIARFNAGVDFDAVDTIATILLALSGQRSTAAEAWRQTGLFS